MRFHSYLNWALNQWELRRRRVHLLSRPDMLIIEATNRCNSNCIMCPHPLYRKNKSVDFGDMTMDTLELTRPFWRSASTVCLSGNGECFLNPLYLDMARRIKQGGGYISTYTNGVLLTPDKSEQLVRMKYDVINVSFAGATPSTYERVRGVDWYETVVNNLKALQSLKQDLHISKPAVRFSIAAMNSAIVELAETIELAAKLGVESIEMPHLNVFFEHVRSESPWLNIPVAKKHIERAVEVARNLGVRFNPPTFVESEHFCRSPFSSLNVRIDGTVTVCTGYRLVVGDLRCQTIEEIWNGAALTEFRSRIKHEGYSRVCPGCSGWQTKAKTFLNMHPAGDMGPADMKNDPIIRRDAP